MKEELQDLDRVCKQIAKNIRYIREQAKLKQSDIAAALGITPGAVGHYEQGRTPVPVNVLLWYSVNFDKSLDFIFGRTQTGMEQLLKDNLIESTSADDLDLYEKPMTRKEIEDLVRGIINERK